MACATNMAGLGEGCCAEADGAAGFLAAGAAPALGLADTVCPSGARWCEATADAVRGVPCAPVRLAAPYLDGVCRTTGRAAVGITSRSPATAVWSGSLLAARRLAVETLNRVPMAASVSPTATR